MDDERIARYRRWYRRLLSCYPGAYRERFAEGMEQTFNDLCRERTRAGGAFVVWVFAETFAGMVRERATNLVRYAMTRNAIQLFKIVKYSAIVFGGLMVAGIITLMILAQGKGEDIAGIVAMAILVTLISVVTAIVAAILQSARERRSKAG